MSPDVRTSERDRLSGGLCAGAGAATLRRVDTRWPPDPPYPPGEEPGGWRGAYPGAQPDAGPVAESGSGQPPGDPGYGYTGGRPWQSQAHPTSDAPYGTEPDPFAGHHRGSSRPARGATGPPGPDRPPWVPALAWTIAFFVAPALLYLAWAVSRSGTVEAGCVDASGDPCASPRTEAVTAFVQAGPSLLIALLLALLAAAGLRRLADTWRAGTVGLAAAVIGAGSATMIATAIT